MNNNAAIQIIPEAVIRTATVDDISRLVEYARVFWDQTNYAKSGIEYDVDTMTETTKGLIDNDVVLYAEDSDGNVVGFLAVMISPFLMNKHYDAACEWGFYVDDEYRRTGLAKLLIEQCEIILKQKNVKFFTLITLANLRPKVVGRFYERMGFEIEETCYTKDLSWVP